MTAIDSVVMALVALGLVLALVQALSQRALLRAPRPPRPDDLPPISVLKPLKGVDADLPDNLRSLFRQEYPAFEVIIGTEARHDPALPVARRVAAEFPHVPSLILSGAAAIGFNPKVNNLANLARRARHPLLVISDSNIRVPADYLVDLAAHRARAGGGLVSSLFRGINGQGLGGMLESLELNGPVIGGLSALTRVLKIPCAVGKSMLIHRDELAAIGGFGFLGQFLAEDQVCAEELARRGRPVVVTGHLIDNVLGRRTVAEFASRYLRWARLRRHLNLGGYLAEALLNPVFLALLGLLALRSAGSAIAAGLALAGMSIIDAWTERMLGLTRPAWLYPPLELARSAVRGVLWFVPLVSRTVVWRGNVLALSARSRIQLEARAEVQPAAPLGEPRETQARAPSRVGVGSRHRGARAA